MKGEVALIILFSILVVLEIIRIIQSEKEEQDMVALYVALIMYGRRTFAQVPAKLKDAVREELAALGLDENGQPLEA